MIKIGFGKRIKPKTFDYKPRFYDPIKEELQERIDKYKETDDKNQEIENVKNRVKMGLRMKHYGDTNTRSSLERQSNIRMFFIIIILGFIGYFILSSNKVLHLIESFSR